MVGIKIVINFLYDLMMNEHFYKKNNNTYDIFSLFLFGFEKNNIDT